MLQIPPITPFIHSPLRPLQDSGFVALIFAITWVFIPVSWKAAYIHVSSRGYFLSSARFDQGRLRNSHHQCIVGHIELLHIKRTRSIHIAHTHTEKTCCFLEADIIHSYDCFHIAILYMQLCPEAWNCMHTLYVCVYISPRKDLSEICQLWSRSIPSESNFYMKILLHSDLQTSILFRNKYVTERTQRNCFGHTADLVSVNLLQEIHHKVVFTS